MSTWHLTYKLGIPGFFLCSFFALSEAPTVSITANSISLRQGCLSVTVALTLHAMTSACLVVMPLETQLNY